MFLKLVAVLLCVTYVACDDVVQSVACANSTSHSTNVRMRVSGCTASHEYCPLYRGTNHTVIFTFVPTLDFMNRTDFRVHGVFEKFSVPYGKKEDACLPAVTTDDETPCTDVGGFVANREYKRQSMFSVSNNYPMIKLRVRFSQYDRRYKNQLMCQELPVEIMDPPESENEA